MEILDIKKWNACIKHNQKKILTKQMMVNAGEVGNVDKSNEIETDNRTDKEQSANNKLSAHEQS